MAYNRLYSRADVQRILVESEGRPRPDLAGNPGAPVGHALSLHTNQRPDVFSRPGGHLPRRDSIFTMPPGALADLVHEALNSVPGQRELVKLNHPQCARVSIESILIRRQAGFDILTVLRPQGQTRFDWLSVTQGDGFIVQLFVLVYKIPGCANEDIHIQTAYPQDYARLRGDEIAHPT